MVIAVTGLGLLAVRCLKNVDQQRASAFLFQNTINNYLVLPLPLVLLIWGPEGVALLVFASMGFELVVRTVDVFLFNRSSNLSEGIRMTTIEACRSAIDGSGIDPQGVASIGFSAQRSVACPVAADGSPVRPMFSWQDARAGEEVEDLRQIIAAERYYEENGLPLGTTWITTKI